MTHDSKIYTYGQAICAGFEYLLSSYPKVFAIGQGLWAPWYVGNSMENLDKKFGKSRIIDSPVSEAACTGAAIGAALNGYRPIVVHPRMDFMLLAIDQIVTQAANWSHMFGAQASPTVTFRAIINRGGEQGAQHSQALHSWFAHVPGLTVVMPATVADARDLLIASVLSSGPVVYIDDRWLYEQNQELPPVQELSLISQKPKICLPGKDVTLVAASYSVLLCLKAAQSLAAQGLEAEVIDLRVINPLDCTTILESVRRTGRLICVDAAWASCGLASEIIASVCEVISPRDLKASPQRLTLPPAPAPTSIALEREFYFDHSDIVRLVEKICQNEKTA